MHCCIGSSLLKVMACHLFQAKFFIKPINSINSQPYGKGSNGNSHHSISKLICFLWNTFGWVNIPDSKVHEANMGPIWVQSAPDGPHVGPMNLAIRDLFSQRCLYKWNPSHFNSIYFYGVKILPAVSTGSNNSLLIEQPRASRILLKGNGPTAAMDFNESIQLHGPETDFHRGWWWWYNTYSTWHTRVTVWG